MTAKLVNQEKYSKSRIIKMSDMKPLDVGRIAVGPSKGLLVMRTASTSHFEVMNLSHMGMNSGWSYQTSLEVELAKNGERFTFEVVGQE
jgi:phosphoenolpyruvate-protein kinase (PTS system EI component)